MADRVSPTHLSVLQRICRRLAGEPILWSLTGSLGLALQGVPVAVHDIDLQTDAAGAYAIERCFAGEVTRPVAYLPSERIRSHLGALEIDGIKVEIMGDMEHRLPSGEWKPAPDLAALRRFLAVEGLAVPVLPLAFEQQAYLELGRTEKAELIRQAIEDQAFPPSASPGNTSSCRIGTWTK